MSTEVKCYDLKESGLWLDVGADYGLFLISRPGKYQDLLKQQHPVKFIHEKLANTKQVVSNAYQLVKDYIENITDYKVLSFLNICEVKNTCNISQVVKGIPTFPLMLQYISVSYYKNKFEYLSWLFDDNSIMADYFKVRSIEEAYNKSKAKVWHEQSTIATNILDDDYSDSIVPEDLLEYLKDFNGKLMTRAGELTGLRSDLLNFGYDFSFILESKDYNPSQFGKQYRDSARIISYRVMFEFEDDCPEYFTYKLYRKDVDYESFSKSHELNYEKYFSNFKRIETSGKFATELFKHMKIEMERV